MHGSGDNQPNVQKSKIQSYSVDVDREKKLPTSRKGAAD